MYRDIAKEHEEELKNMGQGDSITDAEAIATRDRLVFVVDSGEISPIELRQAR
jgi:hypothetical protein